MNWMDGQTKGGWMGQVRCMDGYIDGGWICRQTYKRAARIDGAD